MYKKLTDHSTEKPKVLLDDHRNHTKAKDNVIIKQGGKVQL